MEAQTARHTHPLLIVAAIAITLFSLVGIGAVLGWIPTSVGNPSPASTPTPLAQAPEQPVAQPEPTKRVEEPAVRPRPRPTRSEAPAPIPHAAVPPPPPAPVVAAICRECAVIEEVREVEKAGTASGAGAVGGAVVGGVLARSRRTRKRPWSTRSSSVTRTAPRACSPRPRPRAGAAATKSESSTA